MNTQSEKQRFKLAFNTVIKHYAKETWHNRKTSMPGFLNEDQALGMKVREISERDLRNLDRLIAGYSVVAGLALAFPGRPSAWPVLALAHVAMVGLALSAAVSPVTSSVRSA